jgi:hypothetical protein
LHQVFGHISFRDHLVSQTVCKAWLKPALNHSNSTVDIYGTYGLHELSFKLIYTTTNSAYSGAAIKKIRFLKKRSNGSYNQALNKNKFLFLLASCPNLEEIVFEDNKPVDFLRGMMNGDVVLKKLKNIIVHNFSRDQLTASYYLSVVTKYCNSIERIRTWEMPLPNISDDALITRLLDITSLNRFPLLTHVSITIVKGIDILSLMRTCPNLTHFITNKLKWSTTNKSEMNNDINGDYFQDYPSLQTLGLGVGCFDKETCRFVLRKFTSLHTLKVLATGNDNSGLLVEGFQEFAGTTGRRSSIICLSINGLQGLTRGFLKMLSIWFPKLKELYTRDCGFDISYDSLCNVHFDVANLNLDILSLDITRIITKKQQHFVRYFIEVHQLGDCSQQQEEDAKDNTICYLEDDCSRNPATSPFSRQTSTTFTTNAFRMELSDRISCVYINIRGLRKLRVFSPGIFSQTLSIQ